MIESEGEKTKKKKNFSPLKATAEKIFLRPFVLFYYFPSLSDDCFFIYDIEHGLGLLKWTPHTLSPHYTRP